jgi:HK97 family phage portal protein
MKLTDWLFGGPPQALELKAETVKAKIDLPQAPPLETSAWSLARYASKSEVVYACIEKKAQVACDPELVVQEKNSKGEWKTLDGHRALDTLMNPNPHDDGESFLKTWIASENIAGWFVAEIVRNGMGEPVQLYPLRPDCIHPQYIRGNKGDKLDYYAYRVGGYEVRYKPEELLIHRRHSLGSMYSGMSPLAIALASVDADIAATEYVRDFFNNDGTPAGILKITGRNLSDDEAQRLQQKWKSNYSRNGKNRGGIAVLDERAAYETVGARLNELDSESLTSIDETRICMAFGVPPVIIGAYVGLRNVNQRASFKGAMEEFWMNTMSPELKAIRNFLTRKYLPFFEDEAKVKTGKIRFFWDISNVEALQEDVDAIHDRVALGYKTGFYKLDEARSKVGLDPVGPDLGGEEFYKPTPAVQDPKEDDEEEEKLVEKRQKNILDADTLEKKTFEYEGLTLSREPTEIEKGIDLKAISDSMDPSALLAVVLDIRNELHVQAAKEAAKLPDSEIYTLTLVPPSNAYKRVRGAINRSVAEGSRQIAAQEAGSKAIFTPAGAKDRFEDAVARLVELTVSRIINSVSTAAVDVMTALGVLGVERDTIETELLEKLEERSDKPYENIARQSTNTAVNVGRREEMEARAARIERYVYSAILDKNTCGPCESWDGAEADRIEELPPTPNPECSGGANCRCFIISVFATEVGV